MHYWNLNLSQSWHDLLEIMMFYPLITIGFSVLIFVCFFKVLSAPPTIPSFRERAWKWFISFYAVGAWWGFVFAICVIFISPTQIFNRQSQALAQFSNSAVVLSLPPMELQTGLTNGYADHIEKQSNLATSD